MVGMYSPAPWWVCTAGTMLGIRHPCTVLGIRHPCTVLGMVHPSRAGYGTPVPCWVWENHAGYGRIMPGMEE